MREDYMVDVVLDLLFTLVGLLFEIALWKHL